MDPEARARTVLAYLRAATDEMVALTADLARLESPSDVAATQAPVQDRLRAELEALGFRVRHISGCRTGGALWAVPRHHPRRRGAQLLLGHSDTVWPVGTLETMPVELRDGTLRGPGTFDMKAGLAQGIFALRALRHLGLEPPLTPVWFINSDEEIGSPETRTWVARIARRVRRAFVLEPSLGPEGRLKTARKGVARYHVIVHGKAAHAGLDPTSGASATEELAHVVQELHALTDLERGLTVNVGVVEGGTRPNVIAARAEAWVDVRVERLADAEWVDARIRAIRPSVAGTRIEVEGGLEVPPLERTPRNRALWNAARTAAERLGIALDEERSGGGSDGNTTSLYTATLDGLGAVGDGAHATHEHVVVARMPERAALVAELLMAPPEPPEPEEAGRG